MGVCLLEPSPSPITCFSQEGSVWFLARFWWKRVLFLFGICSPSIPARPLGFCFALQKNVCCGFPGAAIHCGHKPPRRGYSPEVLFRRPCNLLSHWITLLRIWVCLNLRRDLIFCGVRGCEKRRLFSPVPTLLLQLQKLLDRFWSGSNQASHSFFNRSRLRPPRLRRPAPHTPDHRSRRRASFQHHPDRRFQGDQWRGDPDGPRGGLILGFTGVACPTNTTLHKVPRLPPAPLGYGPAGTTRVSKRSLIPPLMHFSL